MLRKIEENEEEKDGKVIRQERFSGAIRRSGMLAKTLRGRKYIIIEG